MTDLPGVGHHRWRKRERRLRGRAVKGVGACLVLLFLYTALQGALKPVHRMRELLVERAQLESDLRQAYAEQRRLLMEQRILASESGLVIEAHRYGYGLAGEERVPLPQENRKP